MQREHRFIARTALFTLSAAALVAVGCGGERHDVARKEPTPSAPVASTTPTTPTTPATAPVPTTVDRVKEVPARFYGKEVRVTGTIDKLYGERAFDLEGTGWAFNDNIAVLTKTPVAFGGAAVAKGDEVIVDGVVHPFAVADIERRLGWDLQTETEIRLKERPVLIADSIRKMGETGRWSAESIAEQPIAAVLTIITASEPANLAGRKVDLPRERVQSVTEKGVWVGPTNANQVFVRTEAKPTDVKAGDTVKVSGTLKQAPADAAKTWQLPPESAALVREEMLYVDGALVSKVVEVEERAPSEKEKRH